MSVERVMSGDSMGEEEERINVALRPETLDEYIGQSEVIEKLKISMEAAKMRKEPLEHILFYGPPGLGKTTLAYIIAKEMDARLVQTSGPALMRRGDLMGILTNLDEGDVFFIDEIHRLSSDIEEFMYPAIEDFKADFTVDKGAYARVINLPLKRFTLVGATTRAGFLTAALRERFGIFHHLDFYPPEEIKIIVERSARLLETPLDSDAGTELARRGRGTPRIVNRLLRRVRDYAQVKADGKITLGVAREALALEGIDELGLDNMDRKFLATIIDHYGGGPVGIEALSATLSEERDTLEDMIEPYLLKAGLLQRTPKGRVAPASAYKHLEKKPPKNQGKLFE